MKVFRDENGNCINIGDWDYQGGTNPLPEGAAETDEIVIVGWDGGLYVRDDPRAIAP